jgi:hypothetical protein
MRLQLGAVAFDNELAPASPVDMRSQRSRLLSGVCKAVCCLWAAGLPAKLLVNSYAVIYGLLQTYRLDATSWTS